MHVLKTSFNGNPNVGLYAYCSNEYCLLGREVPEHRAKELAHVLGVPVHQMSICGTPLLGVFVTGNSRVLLVPEIAFDNELRHLDKLGIGYEVIKSRLTALGNNLLCNDRGCLASTDFSADQKKRIRQALGVSLKPGKIAGLNTVGSLAALNSRGCMIHRDVTGKEKEYIEGLIGLKCIPSTVNMGSPYIKSGLICNDNGFVVGDLSGGPEIVNIEEELGFLGQSARGEARHHRHQRR
ncbi:translation initiation factor IF-6 [Candidatus Woesearchaeota archaeon]|nr:translation initiation factor IF-6 [Candidatus Woesearchaeota archaeon]